MKAIITYNVQYSVEVDIKIDDETEDLMIGKKDILINNNEWSGEFERLLDLNEETIENLPIPIVNNEGYCLTNNVEYVDNSFEVVGFYLTK